MTTTHVSRTSAATAQTPRTARRRLHRPLIVLAATLAISASACGNRDDAPITPESLIDHTPGLVQPAAVHTTSTDTAHDKRVVRVAQLLYTFWNGGDTTYLDAAVSPEFRDNTLPAGRPQGPRGPARASADFRTAIPDLSCRLGDLYITGDTFTARLVFAGHFTGRSGGVQGSGQPIRFNAIDIQHVGTDSTIIEDWHIEDNLGFMQQAGLTKGAAASAAPAK